MKKIFLTVTAALSLCMLTLMANPAGDHCGKPQQVDGLNVYIMSEPVDAYYKLGQVGSGTNTKLSEMIKQVVKNVKKQYPDADGAMLDAEKSLGYAIKFK